jgi:hypothetical protein
MTPGTHFEHLIPHLVWAMGRGNPDRRHWQRTYNLSDEATTDLFSAAIAIIDAEQAERDRLRALPEAESEAA